MNREQKLKDIVSQARKELDKIESARARSENRKLVGKCFKYRNCYSCPQTVNDYWWLYIRVTKGGSSPECTEFQHTSMNRYEVRINHFFHMSERHIEISYDAYLSALRSFLEDQKRALT